MKVLPYFCFSFCPSNKNLVHHTKLALFFPLPSSSLSHHKKCSLIIFFIFQIAVDEGQEMSLLWQCQFYEVSAAESYAGVSLAFQSLIREARSSTPLKSLPSMRRKTSPAVIGKMIGIVFGKNSSKANRAGKKRPSLSIWRSDFFCVKNVRWFFFVNKRLSFFFVNYLRECI